MSKKPVIIITSGDPAGIGPEVTFKALEDASIRKQARFIVIGDGITYRNFGAIIKEAHFIDAGIITKKITPGKISPEYGQISIQYLKKALALLKEGRGDCLVTGPVNKASINRAGYAFSGHTEFLAQETHTKHFLMLLVNKKLRVGLVTRHIPLKKVSSSLSVNSIVTAIRLTRRGLREYFAIRNPRIAVAGLNPHASDKGHIGKEEDAIIKPAIKKSGIRRIFGPYPVDTLFARSGFDAVVAMYHDQGLIPLKLSGVKEIVNITVGLPFIRTSPGHGSAFDIAGKDRADPSSMKHALRLAVQAYTYANA